MTFSIESATRGAGLMTGGAGLTTVVAYAGYKAMGDWLSHHPGDWSKEFGGVPVVIREQATNWNAHKIRLTIVWSPDDKVTGASAEHHTWHARNSRDACLKDLERVIRGVYQAAVK